MAYTSDWDKLQDEAYNNYADRQPFQYSPKDDALYQQYRSAYENLGKQAAADTVNYGKTLRGGYDDTYIKAAAQQGYDTYLQGANDNMANLYKIAQGQYNAETDRLGQLFSNANTEAMNAYNRYMGEENLALEREKFELQKQAAAKGRGGGGGKKKKKTYEQTIQTPGGADYVVYGDSEKDLAANVSQAIDSMYNQQNLIWYRNA